MRNVLGTRNLAEILSERESISKVMQDALDEATDLWGVKVMGFSQMTSSYFGGFWTIDIVNHSKGWSLKFVNFTGDSGLYL